MKLATSTTFRRSALALLVGATLAGAAPATAASPTGPTGESCVIDRNDAARTVHALMTACTGDQIFDLFAHAPLGTLPVGTKKLSLLPALEHEGRQAPYESARTFTRTQNLLGDSLTFTERGATHRVYKNYISGHDAGATITVTASRFDGKPAYYADFRRDFAGLPISMHEYRQLTPTVWIARDTSGHPNAPKPGGGAMAIS